MFDPINPDQDCLSYYNRTWCSHGKKQEEWQGNRKAREMSINFDVNLLDPAPYLPSRICLCELTEGEGSNISLTFIAIVLR